MNLTTTEEEQRKTKKEIKEKPKLLCHQLKHALKEYITNNNHKTNKKTEATKKNGEISRSNQI